MDSGIFPSMAEFFPPKPKISPSRPMTIVVCRPPVRPPVSYQVLPSSCDPHTAEMEPLPVASLPVESVGRRIVPSLVRTMLLMGCEMYAPMGAAKRGKRISLQVAPLSTDVVNANGHAPMRRGVPQKSHTLPCSFVFQITGAAFAASAK